MGDYNPNLPVILGQEWVPIREEDVTFTPNVNAFEHGTSFILPSTTTASTASYYSHSLPAQSMTNQVTMVNVYPKGEEDQSGPIHQVLIPVTSASTTGSGFLISGGSTIPEVLSSPGDLKTLVAFYTGSQDTLWLFFGVDQYGQLLYNKRILNVSLLYAGSAVADPPNVFINPDPSFPATTLRLRNNAGQSISYFRFSGSNLGSLYDLNTAITPGGQQADSLFGELNLGDVNLWWDSTSSPPNSFDPEIIYPWRYNELLRFGSAPTNRQFIQIVFQIPDVTGDGSTNSQIRLDYAALKVTYCEETRVAYGGKFGTTLHGTNVIPLRDTTLTADPSLAGGDYLTTMSMLDPGDLGFGVGVTTPSPDFNGLRELYTLESHQGVRVNVPYPLDDRLGETFTSEATPILPQISLHESDGTVFPEVHVYGRQAISQVYGTVYAQQELLDTPVGVATDFPWVRFIARRWGDTTVDLTLTGQGGLSGSTVSISPADFDELPEILDGWREVTLEFDTPPSMGTVGTPNWRWTATGELAGNRWEILGACAPAISGVPGNLYNSVPTAQRLYAATYLQPTGNVQDLIWFPQGVATPFISGAGDTDDASDVFLIFSQMPPDVSGFGVETLCQPVSGIGQECDLDPCCIPTSIAFNQLSWDTLLPVVELDDFERTTAPGSWNGLSGGGDWTVAGGTVGTDYYVANGAGTQLLDASTSTRRSTVDGSSYLDLSLFTQISFTAVPSAGELNGGQMFLYVDVDNYYMTEVGILDTGDLRLRLRKRQGGANTTLVSMSGVINAYTAGSIINLRTERSGSTIRVKMWMDGTEEPDWQISVVDTSFTAAGQVGLRSVSSATTTVSSFEVNYHYFEVVDLQYLGSTEGFFEIQRMDTVDNEWQTIMLSDLTVTTFNDFEARVGIESSYRIRSLNEYNFEGPWSDTVVKTITAPGVAIGCDDGHLLILTTNERQSGSSNLAYSSVWMDEQVQENFAFPEASFVQLQPMYGRDFFTAFRPSERGGEQFTRTILVQAAAIAPETLADFRQVRDLAWEDLSYVCVRDEDGNRWFATIGVPTGRVTNSRRLYMAPLQIAEVTAVPTQVDPTLAAVSGTVEGSFTCTYEEE